jgi:hypothetical protein
MKMLIAEEVVEEWLRQQRYFTIRGIKLGNDEIDLLAVKLRDGEAPDLRHVEVHVSINPISHVTPWAKGMEDRGAKKRTAEEQTRCIEAWVEKKFKMKKKHEFRQSLCQGEWKYDFVVNKVKSPEELDEIGKHVKVIRLKEDVLADLESWAEGRKKGKGGFTASGAPLIDLMLMHGGKAPEAE